MIALCHLLLGVVGADSPDRWSLDIPDGVEWDVASDPRLPHEDHLEMSGRYTAVVVRYGVDAERRLQLRQAVVWPTLRTIPNDTHASLRRGFDLTELPRFTLDGEPADERARAVRFDGVLTIATDLVGGCTLVRTLFPSLEQRASFERLVLSNGSDRAVAVRAESLGSIEETPADQGVYGSYTIESWTEGPTEVMLAPGESATWLVVCGARLAEESRPSLSGEAELAQRCAYVRGLLGDLRLETPEPILDRAFALAKVRAAESVFRTRGGPMHAPGGERYYAAIWANDQAEYVGPFAPFLGDPLLEEATLNCYRLFARYLSPEYRAIPSSIIAEGTGTWGGAGDRGDAAMVAYGASRFALALGGRETAEELWPLIEWCLEYCRRRTTEEGAIASDSDELEGRFPSGEANLCTASLTYDALLSAACLARELGTHPSEWERRASELRSAIERVFGAEVEGFPTYRYYEGNTVLRAWICIPLTMGIPDRARATTDALFSPRLWGEDGLATEAGKITFWDRSTLYALRGVLAAGETERGMERLRAYARRRLLGEHVPYAVEAHPEGGQAQLSAESGLLCRVFVEGLFGVRPTGFRTFTCTPRLPEGWERMALRDVRAFGEAFDLEAVREPEGTRVRALVGGAVVSESLWDSAAPLEVTLPE